MTRHTLSDPGEGAPDRMAVVDPDGVVVSRRRFLANAAGAAVTLTSLPAVLAACGGGGGQASDVLKFGYTSEIDSLNPFVAQNQFPQAIIQLCYPYLVNQAVEGGAPIEPDLAKSWKSERNGRILRFEIRTGGKWTDGKPVTAEDVVWTINTVVRLKDGAAATLSSYVLGVSKASSPDPTTVVVEFAEPVAPALSNLALLPILPQHVWEPLAAGDGAKLKSAQISAKTVCGGPYRFTKFVPKQIALVERWPDSYSPVAKSNVKQIGWQPFNSDAGMLEALTRGDIDLVDILSSRTIPAGLDQTKKDNIDVNYRPGSSWYMIGFNSNKKKPKHRELLDPRVRDALANATDKERVVKEILYGHGNPGSSIVPPANEKWNDPAIKPEPFDIDLANSKLDKLGYPRRNGVRAANGTPMEYDILVSTDFTSPDRMFSIINDGWEKVGVKLSPKILDPNAMLEAITAPDGKYLSYDVEVWNWGGNQDPNFILSILTTQQIGGFSDTAFSDPEYDRLFEEQLQELDESRRIQLVRQMQQIAFQQKPYIVLSYVNAYAGWGDSWKGLELTNLGVQLLSSKRWVDPVGSS